MKPFLALSVAILAGLALVSAGCANGPITSQQALNIGQPIEAGALTLVLRNNPRYIPIAEQVGKDLATSNWGDVSIVAINMAVVASVRKAGGDETVTNIIMGALDGGIGGYLGAVAETDLSKDPNAVLVLQALGQGIVIAANAAAANPK